MAEANAWLGTGFESFWLGSRLEYLGSLWYWKPTQAHNGYLETYLNLGMVGLFFLGALILSSYGHIRTLLVMKSAKVEVVNFARFGLAFLTIYLLYNITEGAFKSLHFLFVMFLMAGTKYINVYDSRSREEREYMVPIHGRSGSVTRVRRAVSAP